jgi:hypothetical protein
LIADINLSVGNAGHENEKISPELVATVSQPLLPYYLIIYRRQWRFLFGTHDFHLISVIDNR